MHQKVNFIDYISHFIIDVVIIFFLFIIRLLRRKKLPSLVDCFATEDIERGLSVRPSCRFEIFKQDVDVDVSVEGEHTNKIEEKVLNDSGRGTVENNFKKTQIDVVLDIAHNEDAMIALVSKFKGLYPNRILR